jgi:hypothetical protein
LETSFDRAAGSLIDHRPIGLARFLQIESARSPGGHIIGEPTRTARAWNWILIGLGGLFLVLVAIGLAMPDG